MHQTLILLMLLLYSIQAHALSLGDLSVHSTFASPMEADIEIPSYTKKELEDLTVNLAGPEVFKKGGVDLTEIHRSLKFKVTQREDGKAVIRITTQQPVKELGISFFIEARWRGGNIVRAYDILLTPAIGNAPQVGDESSQATAPAGAIDTRQIPMRPGRAKESKGSLEYGPVKPGDILGVIARKMVPNREYSLQQVMVGIFDQNAHAFSDENINQLEPGVMLKLESPESLKARSRGDAVRLIQQHTANWRNSGTAQATSSVSVSGIAASPETPSIFKIEEVDESTLHILAPGNVKQKKDGRIAPREITALRQELTVTLQEAEALKKQNEMLKDKVTELEQMVALRIAQLSGDAISPISLGEQTSIIDKSDQVFQDDLVTSNSDISLQETEEEYFTEIMGVILVVLGGGLILFLYRQKYRNTMLDDGFEPLPFWDHLKNRLLRKERKVTLRF